MRWLILSIIRYFGRYTALPVFVVVCGIGALWLNSLDRYPIAFVLLAFIVVPLFLASIMLLIALFFSGFDKARGEYVSREDAPALWRMWDELAPSAAGRRYLIIDEHMNVGVAERRTIMGLWGQEVSMVVGLPFLLCLDVEALRSVLAHEIGHNELSHTSGTAKFAEFEKALTMVFGNAHRRDTLISAVASIGFGRLADWLEQEILRLSRQHEFEADRIAALRGSPEIEARSSMLCAAFFDFYENEIIAPLAIELRGAAAVPPSPLRRLIGRLDEARMLDGIRMRIARQLAEKPDPNATHPSWGERVAAHGLAELPDIGELGPPAIDSLLPDATRARLIARLDAEWARAIAPIVCPE